MIKKFFNIIYNFIQWTKKWHFFHFLAIGNIILFALLPFLVITNLITTAGHVIPLFLFQFYCFLILTFFALPYSLIMIIINYNKYQLLTIKNEQILKNDMYSIFYILSFASIIISIFSKEVQNLLQDDGGVIGGILIIEYLIFLPFYLYLLDSFKNNIKRNNNLKVQNKNKFISLITLIKHLWSNYRSFFCTFLFSLLVGLLPFLIIIADSNITTEERLFAFIYLIPICFTSIVLFWVTKTASKHPVITTMYAYITNFIIVFIIQCCVGFYFFMFYAMMSIGKIYDDPMEYSSALRTIGYQERIAHFPKIIPKDAKDIELNKETCAWFGSEAIMLKFKTNSQYIDNELKKYTFISIENPNERKHPIDAMVTNNYRISVDDFTFYIINDKEHEKPQEHHFPYHYGIGINKDKDTIIYYYTNPD